MIFYQKAIKDLYLEFKQELEHLYIDTFTRGISAQVILNKEAERYLADLFEYGYGVFGFSNKKLVSALIAIPTSQDKEFPEELKQSYNDNNSIYIAEVLVDENFRGQGIGKRLMQFFEDHLDENINHVFLRVWQENDNAVALYKKSGFEICGQITQEKIRPDTKEKFTMHKNYMVKTIKP